MKKLHILSVLLLIIFLYVPAGSENKIEPENNPVFTAVKNGNDHDLFNAIEKILMTDPSSPLAPFLYGDIVSLAEIAGFRKSEKLLLFLIDSEKKSGGKHSKSRLLRLNLMLEKLYYAYDTTAASEITTGLSPLRSWSLYGPYHKYGYADIDIPFGPETGTADKDKKRSLYIKNRSGTFNPEEHIYPWYGTFYASSSFRIKTPFKIKIQSPSEYKLFINGKEVIRNSGLYFMNERTVAVSRITSVNLLIKTTRLNDEKWSFRVILTDNDDNVIIPGAEKPGNEKGGFAFTEEPPFPETVMNDLRNEKPELSSEINFYLANMYYELDSPRAGNYYRKALDTGNNSMVNLFYSLWLLDFNSSNRDSPDYQKGLRNINALSRTDPPYVPALNRRFRYFFSFNDYSGAYRSARETAAAAPMNHRANYNYTSLLMKMNYTGEALRALDNFKKRFPESHHPFLLEAAFYREKNPEKSLALMLKAIEISPGQDTVRSIIEIKKNSGDYKGALDFASKYNTDGEFSRDIIDLHISAGNLKEAERLISEQIASLATPYMYYLKGTVSEKLHSEGLIYLQKSFHLNNSAFSIYDYASYLEHGAVKNPLADFDDYPVENPFSLLKDSHKKYPSAVLSSKKILMLLNHGASRIFCEEIVYVGSRRGVSRWADYTIPYTGRLYLLSARVYAPDGTSRDTYSLQEINGEYHINFSGVNPGSIIRLAYISDNPAGTIRSSSMFASRFFHPQNYEEPCDRHLFRIIYSSAMKLKFHATGKPSENTKKIGDGKHTVTSFIHTDLPSVPQERFNGSTLNALPFIVFTEMRGAEDFAVWYSGLIPDANDDEIFSGTASLKGADDRATAVNVYNFVSSKVDNTGGQIYFPGDAAEVLKSGKGSTEDRVILARRILAGMGIESAPAFTAARSYPVIENFITPALFSTILLYVPLKSGDLWLDFSNRYYPPGITDSELKGRRAFIVKGNYLETRIISYNDNTFKSSLFRADLNHKGEGRCVFSSSFSGRYSEVKSYFNRKDYHEEVVNKYFSGAVSPFIMDSYSVNGFEAGNGDLEIKAEGTVSGITTLAGNRLIIQPVFNKSTIYRYVLYPQRKQQLVIYSDINEYEEYHITLPEGYKKKAINRSSVIENRHGNAEISIIKKEGSPVITVKKRLKVDSAVIQPHEYSEFLKFCSELKGAESANLIIEKD